MTTDRWQIERRFRGGRTEFYFVSAGDDDEFCLVETVIVKQLGGTVRNRFYGPCGEVLVTLDVGDHSLKLCADYYDLLFLLPENEEESTWVELFARELKGRLDAIA